MGNVEGLGVALPPAFRARVEAEVPGLAEALDGPAPVSVRLNPFKPLLVSSPELPAGGEPVPWTVPGEACYLTDRPVFTADPVFHGGAYYVQEAGSMFVGWLLRRILQTTGIAAPKVLDLCAAPGGKTTQIASVAGANGIVVANETIRSRARILAENVQKWGSGNVAVTSNDPVDFGGRIEGFFDVIVTDVPCSGEGMFRKDPASRGMWSPEAVQLCAARQRRIVSDVWRALRPGGVLIYSTCTFNAVENEENVRWVAEELGGEVLDFDGVPEEIVTTGAGWHFYPHRVRSEGFYAAAIRKTGELDANGRTLGKTKRNTELASLIKSELSEAQRWIDGDEWLFGRVGEGTVYGFSPEMYRTVETLRAARFGLLYSGVELGELVRGSLKPAHALALYAGVNRQAVAVAELDDEAAREYLRKGTDAAALPVERFAEGLNLVVCRGIALGWAKRIERRYNNLYPAAWRVLRY
ncbi:rRNA cytosine-C5-methylase [uncultured Rikenella sp.]|uniref:methyltransferase RsmF C-terminal domain-like protein n=1 Tax=uncultured Rikenella sp. TaxID=368003 RepID=UPI0025D07F2C|nr:rRNA cytosine-C5-methylase [uncultured Rikenella sp.]